MNSVKKLAFMICFTLFYLNFATAKTYPKVEILPDQLMMGTLWHQTSAEYLAIAYQTFNLAKLVLDLELKKSTPKKKAIVLDLDETLLDNSPYQAMVIKSSTGYPHGWFDWIDAAQAKAIPGAVDFLNYADSKGLAIFYLSNRKIKKDRKVPGMMNTLKNMKALGFPQAVESQMYLRDKESSKESRREAISKNHTIIMIFGDNLNDHAKVFEHKNVADRKAAVDKLKDQFGIKLIVLPNAMYGEWEGAIYNYNWRTTVQEKDAIRRKALNVWYP